MPLEQSLVLTLPEHHEPGKFYLNMRTEEYAMTRSFYVKSSIC